VNKVAKKYFTKPTCLWQFLNIIPNDLFITKLNNNKKGKGKQSHLYYL